MFKTRLCRYAQANAADQCPRGDACTFAHSELELRYNPLQQQQEQPRSRAQSGDKENNTLKNNNQNNDIDYTVRWKGAMFAARSSRSQLIALRDTLIRQYRGGKHFVLPPTAPPLAINSALGDDPTDSDDEGPSYLIQSAFETNIFHESTKIHPDDQSLDIFSATESSQVRYLCLEIECCFAEELRRCAEANARRRNWLLMARYLAAAFDLITALLSGIKPWHLALIKHQQDPLPDFHQRQQLNAVLHVLAVVRDQTSRVRDEAIAACESILNGQRASGTKSELDSAAIALQNLRKISF
eukprot:CAMPEP_0197320478 /NCGR_PEP_ID=MMETSP0891-20130614/60146_1 /TAXON_ID=44058 ORGANISM="Aureoumbra lagunensis, Strain CCMP1510" /NCGR_SAMPLE_ID=MMETSP0891 /ASSEMBLY_ACC=CAM_ASM_000534 /LENGTH=298 /DNA_ID=CAMNT_0042811899 /DNA_START=588 /DNA_END=1484 /DNA_ORIENTATION=+